MSPLPKHQKPATCQSCSLYERGFGFATPSGPVRAPLVFIGEALGITEAMHGEPFWGAAGGTLDRLLKRAGIGRDTVRIHNTISCQPPGDWLDGAPWQHAALAHCSQYLEPVLAEPHQVIVTLGAVALKQVLDLWGMTGIRVQDWHGTVQPIESGPAAGKWIVPTFHPAFLLHGGAALTDVLRFDLTRARDVAKQGWTRSPTTLHIDPSPLAFRFWASTYLQTLKQHPDQCWLAVDIETPDKAGGRDEGELTTADVSTQIERVNLAYRTDEAITVPYVEPYIGILKELLAEAGIVLMWFKQYDESRLRFAGHQTIGTEIWDLMWMAHHLQSDLPLGLGFWAPFYSDYPAWKHLAKIKGKEPEYACVDGLQELRCGHGLVKDLIDAGMWDAFYRHTHIREQYVLRPAHDIGLLVDTAKLDTFHQTLQATAAAKLAAIGDSEVAGTLKPKGGYKKKPEGPPPASVLGKAAEKGDLAKAEYLASRVQLVEREVEVVVNVCQSCGGEAVGTRHRCHLSPETRRKRTRKKPGAGDDALPLLAGGDREVATAGTTDQTADPGQPPRLVSAHRRQRRWFWKLPFNPDASNQILKFITDTGQEPGRQKKTKRASGDKETLKRLARTTGNPIYRTILDYKAVKKVDSTYVVGARQRIWSDSRLHPWITFRPSMMRDSCVNPNIQNVVADKEGRDTLAAGFRDCIVAAVGCSLVELDFSGIEAIETGWEMNDPEYIRLAYLGVHAYLASHLLHRPASLAWSNDDLSHYFAEIKKTEPLIYDKAKRCVHGNAYGLTAYGMYETFPDIYPTLKAAEEVQALYYAIAPQLKVFHDRVRDHAHANGYLGGPPHDDYFQLTQTDKFHPYGYRHWFWDVVSYKPLTQVEYRKSLVWATKQHRLKPDGLPKGIVLLHGRPFKVVFGADSKRVIADYPQSLAAGRLKEAQIDLLHPDSPDFIGDLYYGRTPFRAPIHDSLLFECPDRQVDRLIERSVDVMRRPEWRQPCPLEWGLGEYLRVGVAVKVGRDWGHMETVTIPPMDPADQAVHSELHDALYLPQETDQWPDLDDLSTPLSTQLALP